MHIDNVSLDGSKMSARCWVALIGLTCSAFIFNTSEFIPIGLLSDIAADLGISEARTGMVISVYAWVVMRMSMPLMVVFSKMDLNKLMIGVMASFTVFQFCSSVSTGYWMLMASRAGVACSHSLFWAIVTPLAVKIAPPAHKSLAMSMVVTGSSIATIVGLPIGRVIGLALGWRMTFVSVGLFALALTIYLAFSLPKVGSGGGVSFKAVPGIFRNPMLRSIYILTITYAMGYFVTYSFIEPFLKQIAGFSEDMITLTLSVFGVAGVMGSIIFAKCYGRHRLVYNTLSLVGIFLCLALFRPIASSPLLIVAAYIVWGIIGTAFNVGLQSEIIASSRENECAVAMAIFSGIFNCGIGTGALIGGAVTSGLSVAYIGYFGAAIALVTLLFWLFSARKTFRGSTTA